ncbi:MAG TPA: DUF2147 domain-containing protein [Cytophagaceae bacterium]
MRHKISLLILVSLFVSFNGYSIYPDAILGKWYNAEKTSIIQIYKSGNSYNGKIVWLKEVTRNGKPRTDENNSDEKLRARLLMGMEMLSGFSFEDNQWENGKIYDPRKGETYSCTIKMLDPNKLEVRGYVGISMFGKSTIWTKAD